jgi:hypothetical protein
MQRPVFVSLLFLPDEMSTIQQSLRQSMFLGAAPDYNQKLSTIKLYNFSRSTTFYFGCFFIRGRLKNSNFKFKKFKHSFS